jgi:tetratricopeptide (TPR) repeat protein
VVKGEIMSKQQAAAEATGDATGAGAGGATPSKRMLVTDAIAAAGKLCTQGKLDQAESICRQVLQARPDLADAHNVLGVILHRKGQTDDAVASVRRAIKLNDSTPNYYANLGEMERSRGHLDIAAAALNRAVKLNPQSAQAINNLGIVCYDRREFAKAEKHYRKAIELEDNYAEAHNNLGNALRALGKLEDAIAEYERAIEIREAYPEAYNNMGTVFRDMQMLEQAEASYRRALAFRPNHLDALNNLAMVQVALKKNEDAVRFLGEALKFYPNNLQTLMNLARAHMANGANVMANRAVQLALKEHPDNVDALTLAGQVAHDLDHFDDSIAYFEKSLSANPNNIEALNYYGVALKSVGRLQDARNTFIKALEVQPRAIGTYSNLVDLEKFTADNPLFQTMKRIVERVKNPESAPYMALHFALGKAYDDMGEYATAFHHYSVGARLKRATLAYNEAEVAQFFAETRRIFSKEFIERREFPGNPSTAPIFIVGMPRSGSTLTEQIISAHPKVFGAGEIKNLSYAIGAIRLKFPSLPKFPALAEAMKPNHFGTIAKNYLAAITRISNSAERVTDKLLTNFFFAGLIHMMFPNAKIVHTKRNPIDSCLSTWTKLFKDDMPHSYDLGELGRYHRRYQELMDHWREVLPADAFLEVQYEDVVADPETNARRVIDFLELEWDPRCLKFHESDRPVKTASVSQVRKPIYKTSVERGRRYGDKLNPLIEALGLKIEDESHSPSAPTETN